MTEATPVIVSAFCQSELLFAFFGERDSRNRLQDAAGDLVGIALGVRTAIFQVTFIVVVHETVRDADGCAAVRNPVVELVNGLRFVQAGETEMIVRAIHGDVFIFVFIERSHEGFKVFLAAGFAHERGGEVGVHARAVPVHVFAKRLAMEVHIHAVFFAQAHEEVAGDPHLVGSTL